MPPNPPPPRRVAVDGSPRAPSDRGVSEVVSFILTFSMITMMIGILYTGGFVSMGKLQAGNQMQNAEGVFVATADSFGELQEGQAPKRAGSLDLDVGASVAVLDESRIDVAVNNATGPTYSQTITTRSLDYLLDDRAVTYETGAVFRSNKGDSAMVLEPDGFLCSSATNASFVSVVTLVDPEGVSVAAGTVTITGIQRSTTLLFPETRDGSDPIDNVTVNVTSRHASAWNDYLTDAPGWEDPDGDGTFVCGDVDQVFVRHTVIEVRANA